MRKLSRILIGAICILVAAVGILAALVATFVVIAFLSIWISEGRLQKEDVHLLVRGAAVIILSAGTIAGVWWISRRVLGRAVFGSSFKQVSSESGMIER